MLRAAGAAAEAAGAVAAPRSAGAPPARAVRATQTGLWLRPREAAAAAVLQFQLPRECVALFAQRRRWDPLAAAAARPTRWLLLRGVPIAEAKQLKGAAPKHARRSVSGQLFDAIVTQVAAAGGAAAKDALAAPGPCGPAGAFIPAGDGAPPGDALPASAKFKGDNVSVHDTRLSCQKTANPDTSTSALTAKSPSFEMRFFSTTESRLRVRETLSRCKAPMHRAFFFPTEEDARKALLAGAKSATFAAAHDAVPKCTVLAELRSPRHSKNLLGWPGRLFGLRWLTSTADAPCLVYPEPVANLTRVLIRRKKEAMATDNSFSVSCDNLREILREVKQRVKIGQRAAERHKREARIARQTKVTVREPRQLRRKSRGRQRRVSSKKCEAPKIEKTAPLCAKVSPRTVHSILALHDILRVSRPASDGGVGGQLQRSFSTMLVRWYSGRRPPQHFWKPPNKLQLDPNRVIFEFAHFKEALALLSLLRHCRTQRVALVATVAPRDLRLTRQSTPAASAYLRT